MGDSDSQIRKLMGCIHEIANWKIVADAHDFDCGYPQRTYCDDVELIQKYAQSVMSQLAESKRASPLTDNMLLDSSVRNIGRLSSERKPRWALVAEQYLIGSTSAHALCVRLGHDPDEDVGGCAICNEGFSKYCELCSDGSE